MLSCWTYLFEVSKLYPRFKVWMKTLVFLRKIILFIFISVDAGHLITADIGTRNSFWQFFFHLYQYLLVYLLVLIWEVRFLLSTYTSLEWKYHRVNPNFNNFVFISVVPIACTCIHNTLFCTVFLLFLLSRFCTFFDKLFNLKKWKQNLTFIW